MRRLALHWQILIAIALGLWLGTVLEGLVILELTPAGVVVEIAAAGRGIGRLFLSLLAMLVVPLVLSSVVSGIASVPDMRGLRRMSAWTLGYYAASSAFAIATGLLLVNVLRPGRGLTYAELHAAAASAGSELPGGASGATASSLWSVFFRMFPDNVIAAAGDNRLILGVITFAILLGIFIKKTGGEHGDLLARTFTALFEVMMRMTQWIISLAPIGVFALVTALAASGGLRIAGNLAFYMLTVAIGLIIHAAVTLPALIWIFARRSPLAFARAMSPALLTAFSTASSNAALPVTLRCIEERAGIPNRVSSFTLPLGAALNMDGTALYEVVAVLFIAQTMGDLSLSQQLVVAVTALVASFGITGIPHAGTVMMVVVLGAVGLPADAVIVILAVDRILDMMRTTVNVWSDSCGSAIVHRQTDRR